MRSWFQGSGLELYDSVYTAVGLHFAQEGGRGLLLSLWERSGCLEEVCTRIQFFQSLLGHREAEGRHKERMIDRHRVQ